MSHRDEWVVPTALFGLLDDEFGFDIDLCATDASARSARYYDKGRDAFEYDWRGVCWLHPPANRHLARWMARAVGAAYGQRATVVCLVPARTDADWWWSYAMCGEMRFLPGRLHFGLPDGRAEIASEGYAVVIFRQGLPISSICAWWWNWRRRAAESAHTRQVQVWKEAVDTSFDRGKKTAYEVD